MKVTTSKSKNAESFYISKSFINDKGVSTSVNVRKLGTLADLLKEHGPTRDDVMKWARAEAKLETQKYKEDKIVNFSFNSSKRLQPQQQVFYRGGYLFLQYFYYKLGLHKVCRKIRDKYSFKFDINSILSDLIYSRILEPSSKRSSYSCAMDFLEPPSYQLHDVYRSLNVLGKECDLIQSETYKNSHLVGKRNDKLLFYDCTNYYFEIEDEDGIKRYGKSKEHRPNPIIQMGMFMDGDGIPLAFSLFPGNANEQTSIKPLEEKILKEFDCQKFIYCSDAGLGLEKIRKHNHMGERAKLMLERGSTKKERRNPNDPARFLGSIAVTDDGETANVYNYLNTEKIDEEAKYDGMYAVSTDLLDDNVSEILSISEKRWQIEECFRIMKTEFEARPIFLQRTDRITSHLLTCFLALIIYRYLEKFLEHKYTCEEILKTLKDFNFAYVKDQGFIPLYKRTELTDKLHEICHFNTDFEFITKSQMRTIQKQSKGK